MLKISRHIPFTRVNLSWFPQFSSIFPGAVLPASALCPCLLWILSHFENGCEVTAYFMLSRVGTSTQFQLAEKSARSMKRQHGQNADVYWRGALWHHTHSQSDKVHNYMYLLAIVMFTGVLQMVPKLLVAQHWYSPPSFFGNTESISSDPLPSTDRKPSRLMSWPFRCHSTIIGPWPAVSQSNKSGASFRAYASRGGCVISNSWQFMIPVNVNKKLRKN